MRNNPSTTTDRENLTSFLQALITAYEEGELGGTEHEVYPDLPSGSRENYLYFTLASAINFQRDSERLWQAAAKTYADPETQFVFFPEETKRGEEEYFTALTKHGLASFPNKHTDIWYRISRTFAEENSADPREFLSSCGYDVITIRKELRDRNKAFPYLRGPKLSNYWLYILDCFTDVSFNNRGEITIVPDSHVIQASVRLGVIDESTQSRTAVSNAWKELTSGTDIDPIDLHAPLWRWSRKEFPSIEAE